ncbi:ras-related protein Rab-22A-like isoform X2 [Dermatophagoides pteronyssinus]|uniref:ras-related protein Rab-22A-like isoform X2 n=1 Tax=Dermatophagoides pteronyssinus TaxID=6956 RepID=UPI003F681780
MSKTKTKTMVTTNKVCNLECKICLLGDTGVGKSSIVQRFVHNTYNPCMENTIGASFMTKTMYIKSTCYKLNIWDTAGQERYKALAPMYYRGANICIVVYDVTSRSSFDSVQSWIRELRTYLLEKCLICIVGNKSDLADRRVVMHYAKQYADSVDAFFIETSAKNCYNITELFINGLNRYREMEQSSSLAGQKDSPNHGQKSTRSLSLKDETKNSGKCC